MSADLNLNGAVAGALVTGGAAQAKTKIAFQDSIQKAGSSTEASQSGCAITPAYRSNSVTALQPLIKSGEQELSPAYAGNLQEEIPRRCYEAC